MGSDTLKGSQTNLKSIMLQQNGSLSGVSVLS